MLAKLTRKNQLTPSRPGTADAVREKLEALGLTERDVANAVDWSRTPS
jgi:hypothetical protein